MENVSKEPSVQYNRSPLTLRVASIVSTYGCLLCLGTHPPENLDSNGQLNKFLRHNLPLADESSSFLVGLAIGFPFALLERTVETKPYLSIPLHLAGLVSAAAISLALEMGTLPNAETPKEVIASVFGAEMIRLVVLNLR